MTHSIDTPEVKKTICGKTSYPRIFYPHCCGICYEVGCSNTIFHIDGRVTKRGMDMGDAELRDASKN